MRVQIKPAFVFFAIVQLCYLSGSFAAYAVEQSNLSPNLTMNLVLNSANEDAITEPYAELVENLIRQFPKDIYIDETLSKKLKAIDPAFDYMNVVAYLPRFGKEGQAQTEGGLMLPNKRIELIKVAIKTGKAEGKDVSALEEVLKEELNNQLKQQTQINSALTEVLKEQAAQQANNLQEQTFILFDHHSGSLRLFDTPETAAYLTKIKENKAPDYIMAMIKGKNYVETRKIAQKAAARHQKEKVTQATSKPAQKVVADVKEKRLYFLADQVDLTVAQRQKLIKWAEALDKKGVKDNFSILVSTFDNPFVDELSKNRLQVVRGFLRQLDINLDAGHLALAYVKASSIEDQFIELENLE